MLKIVIIIITTPNEATKKPIKINEFSKVAKYKTNTQLSTVFLYSCNEQSENEIKKTAFTKRIKCIGIKQEQKCKTNTLKTIKHYSKKLKI